MVGVQEPVVVCPFTSLKLLQHHVRMAYGDLEEFFGGEEYLEVDYNEAVIDSTEAFKKHQAMGVAKEMVVGPPFGC